MSDTVYLAGISLAALTFFLVLIGQMRSQKSFNGRFLFFCCLFSLAAAFVLSRGNVYLFGGFMTRIRGFFSLNPYDYSVMGTLLGLVAGTAAAARLTRTSTGAALDLMTPAAFCALAIARFAEGFSDFGWGGLVFDERFQFFPLCVRDMYEQFHLAVFLFEGIAAVFLVVFLPRTAVGHGDRFTRTFCRFMLSQIFFESLRAETLRIGFVRVQQVECAVFVLVMILIILKRNKHSAGICTAVHLCTVGIAIFCEFALDKITSIPAPVVYTILGLSLIVCDVVLERFFHRELVRSQD